MRQLGTKAETLKLLYQNIKQAKVLPQYSFTVGEWIGQKEKVIEDFRRKEWSGHVIVRSSSLAEDTGQSSAAGKYESVGNVICKDGAADEFVRAVETVIASYDDDNPANQVLVQPMLTEVSICGVAFTLEPNTMGNYYVINYDKNGSTFAITSGQQAENRLYYSFKGAGETQGGSIKSKEMERLCLALRELEAFFGQDNLDVEFAFTKDGSLYILQVRALCVSGEIVDCGMQKSELERIAKKIEEAGTPKPFLSGKKAVYSVMTDWNPAEMIGIRPKPLAMSLYKEIITDSVWAYQRDNYGYCNLRSFPLMADFCGLPYIDVRVSFNSFVPAQLECELREKLVNYYLDCLIQNPQKHDKAEFEIVFSCYTFDLPERMRILSEHGFSADEIQRITEALRNVTNHIIDHKEGLWRRDYEKIRILEKRYDEITDSDMGTLEKIYWLLEDCKRYGTLPFAGLARAAFIAVQILQSMVKCDIITKRDYESFMSGLNTVSSEMKEDFKEMSPSAFLKKYGHLRPGTYDINSLRYDEAPELYFNWNREAGAPKPPREEFRLSLSQLNNLRQKLTENGLTNDVLELFDFMKTVIEGREYGKFMFTRNLSMALKLIGEIAASEGIGKEDCAYLDIQTLRLLYASTNDMGNVLAENIVRGKEAYKRTQALTLPPFLAGANEVFRFYYPDTEPNYITSGVAVGSVRVIEDRMKEGELQDKIVMIPSADPGYDWIFSRGIRGLITMYGGANSHMAIRAGESGIPAAVGIGEILFEKYKRAEILEIDALAKMIRILK